MKKKHIFWLTIIALLIIVQFIPFAKPQTSNENENDLIYNNQIPEAVTDILKTSCYDCHSNETNYPWYSYVAPVSWLVNRDIIKGREELNFSNWEGLNKMDKAKLIDKVIDEVSDKNMPMPIYTVIHRDAVLDDQKIEQLTTWADHYAEGLFE